jgi:membrane protease YdiL (CAAX protease family)
VNSSQPMRIIEPALQPSLILTAFIAVAISLVPQGLWSALIVLNLRTTPRVPWSVPVMVLVLYLLFLYLNGRWPPVWSAVARKRSLRANMVAPRIALWSGLAGIAAIIALVGLWTLLASVVQMPGSVLPNLAAYPRVTAILAVLMGAAISPLCEQAGIWGYWESALLQRYSPATAVIVSAATFALLPHPPNQAPFWAKLIFFFLTGLIFSVLSYLCRSILPGVILHFLALFVFFVYVWPHDSARRLFSQGSGHNSVYLNLAQTALFAALSVLAFRRLSQEARTTCNP